LSGTWYWWRSGRRQTWRATIGLAIVVGVLGAVALGSLAGARRTASAYGRYLRSINSSDVYVNTPGPELDRMGTIASLSGVRASATWIGFNAAPVVHGLEDDDFVAGRLVGTLNGEYFTQDRMTVLAGRLPRLSSTDEVALNPSQAALFGVGVGGRVTYNFFSQDVQTFTNVPQGSATYTVTGIVSIPPVLVDEVDLVRAGILPPAATTPRLVATAFFWQGLQLDRGPAGIPQLQAQLAKVSAADNLSAIIHRVDAIHQQVQASIRPEALALAIFGLTVVLALILIVAQSTVRLIARWAPDRRSLRAMGATTAQVASGSGLDSAVAVALGMVLAVAGAVALSPLSPIGTVRTYDPSQGVQADLTVLLGCGLLLALLLGCVLALLSWRGIRRETEMGAPIRSTIAGAAAFAGLGVPAVVGARMALEPGRGSNAVPVRATILGSVVAVIAVVSTLVFGASLTYLIDHPQRYGWGWSRLLVDQGGYGAFALGHPDWNGPAAGDLSAVRSLMASQPGVVGWSMLGYAQGTIDGRPVPIVGLLREVGSVEPPTGAGRPLGGPSEIELGSTTLRQLGKHLGQTVKVDAGTAPRTLTIVGQVTFPSVGVEQSDIPSLGTGAIVDEDTLLGLTIPAGPQNNCSNSSSANAISAGTECLSTIAVRLAPGINASAWAARVVAANPDQGTPGGTYDQPVVRAAAIVGYTQMTDEPLVLAALLALGALASLAFTLAAAVRQRRRDLTVLRTLGLTGRQLRQIVAWQATLTVLIALVIGVPIGLAAGRVLWIRFADNLGVINTPAIPLAALAGFALGLVALANLIAARPAAVAARLRPAQILRSE
jgi:MacB-like periplasmic core domain/FtsX-like permease family